MLGCFDTKGEIFAFLRNCLLEQGADVITVNVGVMGSTSLFPVDVEAAEICEATGKNLAEVRSKNDRGFAMETMGRGAAKILADLLAEKAFKAVIGMGGGSGTYVTLKSMQFLPLGLPKICISTLASKDLSDLIGVKDVLLMPSVVDVAALNSIIKPIIQQAAAAVVAMSKLQIQNDTIHSKRIAISVFGNTNACVDHCIAILESRGYEVMTFHANGLGGKALESLTLEGCFAGILDITTTELADELCGGICSAGTERLEAAGKLGIPQVVVPGCMDMVNFGTMDSVPEKYKNRQLYSWVPTVTLMRTNEKENKALGSILAEKLNQATGKVSVLFPEKGLSQIDSEGNVFYNPAVNQILSDCIEKSLNSDIAFVKLPFHINDRAFAEEAVGLLLGMMEQSIAQCPAGAVNAHENGILAKESNNDGQQEKTSDHLQNRSSQKELRGSDEGSIRAQAAARLQQDAGGDQKELKGLAYNTHESQEAEKRSAFNFAKENNLWIEDITSLGIYTSLGGNENTIIASPEDGVLYKSNNLFNSENSIRILLEQLKLHNEIFPDNALEVVGFTGFENKNRAPYVEVILKQDYVPNSEKASYEEIGAYMEARGFKPTGKKGQYIEGKYTVSDLHPRNVLKDEFGNINVIDNIIRENHP